MTNKYRTETIRKRQRFEEKTGWEDINDGQGIGPHINLELY
jgi:hypothetical protein